MDYRPGIPEQPLSCCKRCPKSLAGHSRGLDTLTARGRCVASAAQYTRCCLLSASHLFPFFPFFFAPRRPSCKEQPHACTATHLSHYPLRESRGTLWALTYIQVLQFTSEVCIQGLGGDSATATHHEVAAWPTSHSSSRTGNRWMSAYKRRCTVYREPH